MLQTTIPKQNQYIRTQDSVQKVPIIQKLNSLRLKITNLKLVNAVSNRDKFVGSPDKSFLLDGLDALLQLGHVCLVVPRLYVQQHGGLGDKGRLIGLLGGVGLKQNLGKSLIRPHFWISPLFKF